MFWLAHGLFALILIGQSNFLLLFLGYAIQSGAMVTFAHFFLRFPSATYFVTDCFLFVVFFVLIVIGQSKLLCFCSWDIQLKTVQHIHSTYTHVLESLLNINEPYKKSLFYNVVISTEGKRDLHLPLKLKIWRDQTCFDVLECYFQTKRDILHNCEPFGLSKPATTLLIYYTCICCYFTPCSIQNHAKIFWTEFSFVSLNKLLTNSTILAS